MAKSRTQRYYDRNPKARAKKAKYDKTFGSSPKQKAKRAELGRKRYADKKKGKKIAGKDYDHATGRYVSPKVNRGRKGEGGRKNKRK